jgi:galactokinase
VNLIGEHTDYNDGFVLPMAIQLGTTVAAAPRNDSLVRAYSVNLDQSLEFDLQTKDAERSGTWLDYVQGVAAALIGRGSSLRGADLAISSDVPIGGGLSSSAALEMASGAAFLGIAGAQTDGVSLAKAGQLAEHRYVGINSGIMDQFIAVFGKQGHALLIDCRLLEGRLVPLRISGSVVAICDTRIKHTLASSEYNARRAQCEQGVALLRQELPAIRALRDVTLEDLHRWRRLLPEPVFRRCRHVIGENQRTLAAARSLEAGELDEMGRLMYASHESLRNDYEVSCRELDILVEAAASVAGVWGARMTGGGFGGCTVNLVRGESFAEFSEVVAERYSRATGLQPAIFAAQPSDGVRELHQAGQ